MQDKLTPSTVIGNRDHVGNTVGSKVRVGPRAQERSQPEIHVQKQEGRIASIVVTCSCGEQVTIVCDYEEQTQ